MLELKRITTEYAWGISDDIHPEVREAGVYLLYDKNNFLIYIGQSINIHQRLKSHCKNDNKEWDYARVIIIENQGHRYVVEKLLIEYINPFNNKLKASCSDVNFNLNIEKLMNMQKLSCISLLEINKLENIIDEFQSQNILDLELSIKINKQISKFKCEIMNLNYLIASYVDFANLGLKQ